MEKIFYAVNDTDSDGLITFHVARTKNFLIPRLFRFAVIERKLKPASICRSNIGGGAIITR